MEPVDRLAVALRVLLENPERREQAERALAAYDAWRDRQHRYRELAAYDVLRETLRR
jgi:hypothetical protein